MFDSFPIKRRIFLASTMATAGAYAVPGFVPAAEPLRPARRPICAFVKFIQQLSHEELARTVADLGFDGIEATVRRNGQISPERVEEELPKLADALGRQGLAVNVMTTDVNRADDPLSEKVLRTAAALGIRKYRMAYYRYDLSRPVLAQLEELRPMVRDLGALNRELGLTAVYQNHAGANYVGASLWDLALLLRDIPADRIGVAFDIRHATVEGGMAWPVSWNVVQPHLGAVFVKDFDWVNRKAANVPLGQGMVSPQFFKLLRAAEFDGPISLHVEYLEAGTLEENIAALGTDLKTLRRLLTD